eukprot:gene11454-1921_t
MATQVSEGGKTYSLHLFNAIGSPLDTKYTEVEPSHLAITPYHVVAASHSFVYVWQYRTKMSKLTSVDLGTGSLRRKDGRELCFHIDDSPATASSDAIADVSGREPTADSILAVGASQHCLLVARDSGQMLRFSLPHIMLEHTYTLRGRAQSIAINCDSTRASIIDSNGVLTMVDLGTPGTDIFGGDEVTAPAAHEGDAPVRFERKDVWDLRWSDDNPALFALMEKTRMFIFDNLVPEEPVLSSAYICSFSQLEIRAIMLDQLMREPEAPNKEYAVTYETRALKEARELKDDAARGEGAPATRDGTRR